MLKCSGFPAFSALESQISCINVLTYTPQIPKISSWLPQNGSVIGICSAHTMIAAKRPTWKSSAPHEFSGYTAREEACAPQIVWLKFGMLSPGQGMHLLLPGSGWYSSSAHIRHTDLLPEQQSMFSLEVPAGHTCLEDTSTISVSACVKRRCMSAFLWPHAQMRCSLLAV